MYRWGRYSSILIMARPLCGIVLKDKQSARCSSHTSADRPTGMTDRRPCYAHAVDTCPTDAAGSSNFRNEAFGLCNRGRCHRLSRYCEAEGECGNSERLVISSSLEAPNRPAGAAERWTRLSQVDARACKRIEIDQSDFREFHAAIAAHSRSRRRLRTMTADFPVPLGTRG
jgi:hypothetical protein